MRIYNSKNNTIKHSFKCLNLFGYHLKVEQYKSLWIDSIGLKRNVLDFLFESLYI